MKQSGKYALREASILERMLACRRLQRDDQPLPVWIRGDAIDLQMAVGSCTFLASSYDYFDGCHHWLSLLTKDGKLIDQLRMPDQFGYIREVQLLSASAIAFGYLGTDDRWTLAIDEQGFRSYSRTALSARPNRFLLSRRYLTLRRQAS